MYSERTSGSCIHRESPVKRRTRTIFTEAQCMTLEKTFHETHYPDQLYKRRLALFLNIPEERIMVWFQNRRAKWRRKQARLRQKHPSVNGTTERFTNMEYENPKCKHIKNGAVMEQICSREIEDEYSYYHPPDSHYQPIFHNRKPL